jgi:hypothetical protein
MHEQPPNEQYAAIEDTLASLMKSRRTVAVEILLFRRKMTKIRLFMTTISAMCTARTAVDSTLAWRPGAILIAVAIIGGLVYAASISVTLTVSTAIIVSVVSSAVLIYPSDEAIHNVVATQGANMPAIYECLKDYQRKLAEIDDAISRMRSEVDRRKKAREDYTRSKEYRLRELLRENWKAMRSIEFESYLERVFHELGYHVETTKVTGDQGVDLVLQSRGIRIAVQVKGYVSSVSNGAIQEAYTGKAHYRCDACVVITNSRFTSSACELAESVRCVLVDEDMLPKVILAEVDLASECVRLNRQTT